MKLEITGTPFSSLNEVFNGGERCMNEGIDTKQADPPPRGISHTIFIGQKPLMTYVTAIVMQFNSGTKELSVKAPQASSQRQLTW